MKYVYTLFLLSFFYFQASNAQHKCGTDIYYEIQKKNNPDFEKAEIEFNKRSKEFANQPANRAAIYTIPVVFHVIHTNGPENVSKEQILDQLRILNNDFNLLNANKSKIRSEFAGLATDCQIQFKMAAIDPNGKCTDGINRVYSPLGVDVDQATEEVKQLVQWNYQKYLNIWVVTSIKTEQTNGTILGYAQFPWNGSGSRDGIVVRHDRLGSIGTALQSDSGRTLTHEVGHWLGLYHTFQGGCNGGDQCDDTPPVASAFTNASCPANSNSCNTDFPDMKDMWENYMDYSDGSCMAMFTPDQKDRMHQALKTFPRSSNVSSTNLTATGINKVAGTPLAAFTSSHRIICAGQPVTFYDISCKTNITARSWSLPGSSTPSSTLENPVVVYQTPGKYKVTLTVQNGALSDNEVVDNYIEVISPSIAGYPNIEEGFEDANLASRGYRSVSPVAWQQITSASYTGSGSFKAPVSTSDPAGTTYSFVTPPVDISALNGVASRLSFYVSYAQPNVDITETLRVYISTDCGNSFKQIMSLNGTGLSYIGAPYTSGFVPTQKNHWKLRATQSFTSLGYSNEEIAIFRMDVVSAKGNPVYIDNLNISQWFAGVQTVSESQVKANLYPNPSQGLATLDLEFETAGTAEIGLYDLTGRKVASVHSGSVQQGLNSFRITKPAGNSQSLFVVRVDSPLGQISKPITFAP